MTAPMRILSLGAGVQSSTLALMIAKGEVPMVEHAIFADTGAEPRGVYDWLDWLEKQLPFPVHRVAHGNLEADILASVNDPKRHRVGQAPFYVASEGEAKEGMLWRKCTKDYKVNAIHKKVRELVGLKRRQRAPKTPVVDQLIGISLDEAIRMKQSSVPFIRNCYPLVDMRMTRQHCLDWMAKNYPARVPAKSACYFCPYTDDSRWREMKLAQPDEFARAVSFDASIRTGLPGVRGRAFLHRSLLPLDQIDFRNAADMGQQDFFGNECEGMCGV